MRKLRNISYLRFGSKIRQGFAGGITSLTPPILLSPLWISWAENEDAREGVELLYPWREPAAPLPGGRPPAAPPIGGRQEACRPAGGLQTPAKDLYANKIYIYLHIGPYRPLPGGRGIEL